MKTEGGEKWSRYVKKWNHLNVDLLRSEKRERDPGWYLSLMIWSLSLQANSLWQIGSKERVRKKRKVRQFGRINTRHMLSWQQLQRKQTQMIVNFGELLQTQCETTLYWKQSSGEWRKNLFAVSLPYPASHWSKSVPQGFNPFTLLGMWPCPSKAPIRPNLSQHQGVMVFSLSAPHMAAL